MRRLAPASPALLLGAILALGGGFARAEVLSLDPASTKVAFTLGATLHTVHGTARLSRGEIRFDPASGEASGEVVIDARSASTGEAKRDQRMHAEILQTDVYPEIVFTAARLTGAFAAGGDSDLSLEGTIQIHGETHPLTIAAHVHAEGSRLSGTATFVVPYVAWGMKDPSVFILRVRKEVKVSLEIAGSLAPAAPS